MIKWKRIEKVPEDWLDGRKILVFDAAKMSPSVMMSIDGEWSYNGETKASFCKVTHYAEDVDSCPDDLPEGVSADYLALSSKASRLWAINLAYAKSTVGLEGNYGLKHRPLVLYTAMLKMADNDRTVKVYRKRVAEAWQAVYKVPFTHLQVAHDLRAIVSAGLASKLPREYEWRDMVPDTYKVYPPDAHNCKPQVG